MKRIVIQSGDFDIAAETAAIARQGGGAIASFIGQVRADDQLLRLELEHYPAMTEKALDRIAEDALKRWALHGLTIIHRFGMLELGDNIVLVLAASDHRQAAIAACSYVMDQLKTVAPFWKKQFFRDGSSDWVVERVADLQAAKDWQR